MAGDDVVLEASKISKVFPGTVALEAVDFAVRRGKVNALVGENGAGKSTLVKILAGVERPTRGRLLLEGREVALASAREAAALGIGIIHQELNLCPNLDVADNIFLGAGRSRGGLLDRRRERALAREWLARLEQAIDVRAPTGDLPLGRQQIVEIVKALVRDVRILMMDEPTSALSGPETAVLFRLIRDLTAHGVSIVYISHRLEEMLSISDFVTVLRDGRRVEEAAAREVNVNWIVERMTGGRRREAHPAPAAEAAGRTLLRARVTLAGAGGRRRLEDARLQVRAGEIVGLYGLMGSGRTELLEALAGVRESAQASLEMEGRRLESRSVRARIHSGLVLVPEDRQAAGLLANLSVRDNITIASLSRCRTAGVLDPRKEREAAEGLIRQLHIKTASVEGPVTALSGGNQQKVVMAKCLMAGPRVLLLDEPTRGVDVGARAEIYDIMRSLAAQGLGIVFSSSELAEIFAVATRIVVLAGGRVTGEYAASEVDEETLVAACAQAPQAGGQTHAES